MKEVFYLIFILCFMNLHAEDIYATFTSKGIRESALKLNSSGIVDTIKVNIGSKVKKGDILLKIQNNTQVENVNIQQAQVNATEQTYLFQKSQFDRYEQSKSVIDKNTYDQIYSNFKNAENNYKMALATLNYQKELLNNTYLKAPFDGIIADKSIELGEGVSQNSTELFRLISNDVKLIIEFDSKYVNKVKVGDKYIFSTDSSNNKKTATITKVYPSIDINNRKLRAEALVKNMISGVFGDGYIRIK